MNYLYRQVIAEISFLFCALWNAYSFYTTAAQVPGDVYSLANILSDPPLYALWVMTGATLALTLWLIYCRKRVGVVSVLTKHKDSPALVDVSGGGRDWIIDDNQISLDQGQPLIRTNGKIDELKIRRNLLR